MKPVWFIVLGIAITLSFFSCQKNRVHYYEPPAGPQAGPGGHVILNVIPYHKGINIDSGTVYIKYNTLLYPDSTYDDSTKIHFENGVNHCHFLNLKAGNYFIYAYGWNNVTSDKIWGSSPVIIQDSFTIYNLDLQMQTQ